MQQEEPDPNPARGFIFAGGLFLLQFCNGGVWSPHRSEQRDDQPTMTIHELNEEIRDRRALARHAKRHGLKVARLWHVQLALNARAELRHYATR